MKTNIVKATIMQNKCTLKTSETPQIFWSESKMLTIVEQCFCRSAQAIVKVIPRDVLQQVFRESFSISLIEN